MDRLQIFLILVPVLFLAIVLNGIVHEAGHGLFVLLFGGEINYIQPLIFFGNPHISYSDLSMLGFWERALVIAGGALLPILVGIIGVFMIPFLQLRPVFAFAFAAGIFSFISQALAWIFLPAIYQFRGGFQGDDTIAFIQHTEIHPLIVSSFALMVFTFCTWLFLRKTRFLILAKNLHRKKPLKPKPNSIRFPIFFLFCSGV